MISIKNLSTTEEIILVQKRIAAEETYDIPTNDVDLWASDDEVMTAISSEQVQVFLNGSGISGISNQINILKDTATKNVSVVDRVEARTVNCQLGRKLHSRYVSFKTADNQNFDNTGINNQDFGDVTYKMYKWVSGSRVETTTNSEAEETWIIFTPSFSYEISGGDVDVPAELPVDQSSDEDLWEVHVSANMLLDMATSGTVPRTDLIANPRAKFKKGINVGVDSSLNPAEMPYNDPSESYPLTGGLPYPTNEITLVIKHPAGKQAEFQWHLKLYK